MELKFDEAPLDTLVDLRDRTLSPGHPGRPVVWPYDTALNAFHFGAYSGSQLVGCVSVAQRPFEDSNPQTSFRFHSMGIEPDFQGRGVGTFMLHSLVERIREKGTTCLWATARPSAISFYEHIGLELSDYEYVVEETGFRGRYVFLRGERLQAF